jgi:hypothetical protein
MDEKQPQRGDARHGARRAKHNVPMLDYIG